MVEDEAERSRKAIAQLRRDASMADEDRIFKAINDAIDFDAMNTHEPLVPDPTASRCITYEDLVKFMDEIRHPPAWDIVVAPHPSEEKTTLERLEAAGLVGIKIVPNRAVEPGTLIVITPKGVEASERVELPITSEDFAEYHSPWADWRIPMPWGSDYSAWKIVNLGT